MFGLRILEDLKNWIEKKQQYGHRPAPATSSWLWLNALRKNDRRTKYSNQQWFREINNLNTAICAKPYYCYTVLDVVC